MTVKQRQHLLAYLGYYVGNVDGEWGTLSRTACTAFQKDFGGIRVDGYGGTETDKALRHAVAYDMFGTTISKTETVDKEIETTETWWDDIEFFDRSEFKCKCGGKYCNGFPVEVNRTLVTVAERVRNHFNAPVYVSSGVRCEKHNANVGGVSGSRHKQGKAMDFRVQGKKAADVLKYVQQQPEIRYAYAIDQNYIHMDIE